MPGRERGQRAWFVGAVVGDVSDEIIRRSFDVFAAGNNGFELVVGKIYETLENFAARNYYVMLLTGEQVVTAQKWALAFRGGTLAVKIDPAVVFKNSQ